MASIKFIHTEDKPVKLKSTPIISLNKSKKLSSIDGKRTIYYIETKEAFKLKLESFVDFTQKHPQYENYVVITIPIIRK